MRMIVDYIKCDTSGICVKTCPEIFRFQEGSKKAIALFDRIPAVLEKKAVEAAKSCPSNAIFTIME
ncbi:MAG: ferredoxin [Deltaproteobacteria bacterium]|nr:ferredoxin [Deltaproteobacteria bacterium]